MHNFKTNGNFSKYLSLTNLFRLKISYNRDLVVGLEKVVIRGGKSKIRSTFRTLCSSDSTPKSKTNMVKPRKRRFHLIKSDLDTD